MNYEITETQVTVIEAPTREEAERLYREYPLNPEREAAVVRFRGPELTVVEWGQVAKPMRAAELIDQIRELASETRSVGRQEPDPRFAALIYPLANALELCSDLFEQQQGFLLGLRDMKADAPRGRLS